MKDLFLYLLLLISLVSWITYVNADSEDYSCADYQLLGRNAPHCMTIGGNHDE
jgi:hypothetical protein